MTTKQLEKLGIYSEKSKLYPQRHWCNTTQSYISVYKSNTHEDVLKTIFEEAFDEGIKEGKEQRSNEIKSILNNEDL